MRVGIALSNENLFSSMVIYLMVIGNNRKIMGEHKLGRLTNFFLAVTALVLVAGSVLFFY